MGGAAGGLLSPGISSPSGFPSGTRGLSRLLPASIQLPSCLLASRAQSESSARGSLAAARQGHLLSLGATRDEGGREGGDRCGGVGRTWLWLWTSAPTPCSGGLTASQGLQRRHAGQVWSEGATLRMDQGPGLGDGGAAQGSSPDAPPPPSTRPHGLLAETPRSGWALGSSLCQPLCKLNPIGSLGLSLLISKAISKTYCPPRDQSNRGRRVHVC